MENKIRFGCDYAEGAHEKVLQQLVETNAEQTACYGEDEYCVKAERLILEKCACPTGVVRFLVGGTQTNKTVITACLKPYQGVLCALSAHINEHETGAIEASGHKVLALPCVNGKITAKQVEEVCVYDRTNGNREHEVPTGMVYLSQPTEVGTLYTLAELTAISEVCRKYGIRLYVDGARLASALTAEGNDVFLPDLARLCHVFYIGGTKCGALMGEAVVLSDPSLQADFNYYIKNVGGRLAKGRLLGVQFCALFQDGLYEAIGTHMNTLAVQIKKAFSEKGYAFYVDSETNQQFPVLPNAAMEKLAEKYDFSFKAVVDESHTAVRFCTSWATKAESVAALTADIAAL